MSIYNIIKQLENESSTNKKIEILQQYKNNEELKEFFYLTLSPEETFYIKKIPKYIAGVENQDIKWGMKSLSCLSNRTYTGNAGVDYLKNLLEKLSIENANLIERIIKKDPNCKVSNKIINKIWLNLIKEYPVSLCERNNDKTRKNFIFPAWVQSKEDGMRVNILVYSDKVEYRTRNGKLMDLNNLELDTIFKSIGEGYVYDGEALVVDKNNNILPRKIGNGILNKSIKNTISEKERNLVVFHLWDCIPIKDFWEGQCKIPYYNRYEFLKSHVTATLHKYKVRCIENKWVNNWEEAEEIFKEYLKNGKEGVIVKDVISIWENKRLKTQIKLKAENTADLLCIGTESHSKNLEMIGSLILETSCGKLKTNCGSGLKDEDRLKDPNCYIGNIIEVKYNEIISKEGEEIKSLFLPIFQCIREDKSVANNLEELN